MFAGVDGEPGFGGIDEGVSPAALAGDCKGSREDI